MSLPPGTRTYLRGPSYWRGWQTGYRVAFLLWMPLGSLGGSVVTACALALAWAHMGG